MPTISDDAVRDILAAFGEVDGLTVRITRQLDRDEYVAVNKVLTNLGGKWNRKEGAHVFTVAPGDALDAFVTGGAKPKHVRRTEGYVATPAKLAADIVRRHADLAGWPETLRVLEPSAGDGALVAAILDAAPHADVWAIEPNFVRGDRLVKLAADRGVQLWRIEDGSARPVDASTDTAGTITLVDTYMETFAASVTGWFNVIVMNPPFAVPGRPTIWIDHLMLAWGMLRPNGRVVCFAPAGFVHRTDAKHEAVRDLVDEHGGWKRLPVGAFKESGTDVDAVVLWLDKPSEPTI
jgi:hypothetical protein